MVVRGEVSAGGGANVSDPLFFSEPTMLTSRSFNSGSGEWSALNSAFFSIDTVPADSSNLVISEIHYRPENPSSPEELAVSSDRDDYEFVELQNISAGTIDLSGVRFLVGISYNFPDQTLLGAGERLVLVRDVAAFAVRYPGVVSLGEYSGRLSNDGEPLQLLDGAGEDLRSFAYNDQLPWPTAPDGSGVSLVLVAPVSNPDHANPASWRPSVVTGGNPLDSDATVFDGGDLVAYALGSLTGVMRAEFVEEDGERIPVFTFPKNNGAEDVEFTVEYSSDLARWQSDAVLFDTSPGLETWRTPAAIRERLYWRVRLTLR